MNFLECDVTDGQLVHPAFAGPVSSPVSVSGGTVTAGVRPEHITIDPSGDQLTVELTEALGGVSYAYLRAANGDRLIVEERGDERSREGDRVGISFETSRVMCFEALPSSTRRSWKKTRHK